VLLEDGHNRLLQEYGHVGAAVTVENGDQVDVDVVSQWNAREKLKLNRKIKQKTKTSMHTS
jgi:hypothetical protein